jgi:ribonuclease BN (tRNA processing enzyme)
MEYNGLDAIVISHMHPDHFLDLIPLRYGLKYGPLFRSARLPVWLPPGAEKQLRALTASLSDERGESFLDEVFHVREYDPAKELQIGDLRLSFAKTVHFIDAYAIRVENAGAVICYSADTAPCESVARLARGCDVFLCETTVGLGTESGPVRGHLTAAEAGRIAREARVDRLVLTHYGTDVDPNALVRAAADAFGASCIIADDGTEFTSP